MVRLSDEKPTAEKKMKTIVSALISVILLTACQSTSDNDANVASTNKKNNNVVCENMATTGSHIKKRTCMSKAQAKAIQKDAQESMRRAQERGRTSTTDQ